MGNGLLIAFHTNNNSAVPYGIALFLLLNECKFTDVQSQIHIDFFRINPLALQILAS